MSTNVALITGGAKGIGRGIALDLAAKDLGLKVTTSNLCSEITLPTGKDHLLPDQ